MAEGGRPRENGRNARNGTAGTGFEREAEARNKGSLGVSVLDKHGSRIGSVFPAHP